MAEDLHQNGGAFHTANGMLNKDPDLTQDFIRSLVRIAQLRMRVLLALARLLRRDFNLITLVVRLNPLGAHVNPNMEIFKPVQRRRKLLFQHAVIVIVPATRPTEEDDKLVRERPHRIRQRRLFFSHCNAHVVLHHLLTDDRLVRWPQ
jgi:hypothetical protein